MIIPSQENSDGKSDSGIFVPLLNVGFSGMICACSVIAQRKKERKKERKKFSSLHNEFMDIKSLYPMNKKSTHYVVWGRTTITLYGG